MCNCLCEIKIDAENVTVFRDTEISMQITLGMGSYASFSAISKPMYIHWFLWKIAMIQKFSVKKIPSISLTKIYIKFFEKKYSTLPSSFEPLKIASAHKHENQQFSTHFPFIY